MKNTVISLSMLLLLTIVSCSEDNSSSSPTEEVVNTVSDGTWRISYFFDNDQDETSDFSGYNFKFDSNNVLTASNGTNTYTGTWSLSNSNSNDDSMDDLDFNISFSSPDNFHELSEDWNILTRSSSKIELQHESGGDGGIDLVTFEKN